MIERHRGGHRGGSVGGGKLKITDTTNSRRSRNGIRDILIKDNHFFFGSGVRYHRTDMYS